MDRDNRILLRVSFRNCTFYCKTEQLLEEMKVISIKREIWTEEMINKIELPNMYSPGGRAFGILQILQIFFLNSFSSSGVMRKGDILIRNKRLNSRCKFLQNSTLTNIQIEAEAFRSSILQYLPRCFLLLFLPSQHKTNNNFMIWSYSFYIDKINLPSQGFRMECFSLQTFFKTFRS